jgi:hypothetical protein
MTVPAKMVVTDTEAIALYVAAGNPRGDWPNVDEAVRLYYRLEAKSHCAISSFRKPSLPTQPQTTPLPEASPAGVQGGQPSSRPA